jgi:gliding motility-associated-like protein
VLLPGGTATMAGTGIGTWAPISFGNPGTATITSPASPTTTITGFNAAGNYHFVWTNPFGCTDTVLVTVTQEPVVSVNNTAYCLGGSAALFGTVAPAGGSYLWSNGATTQSINIDTNVTSTFTVTYTLGTCPASATGTVTVFSLPTAAVTTIPAVCTAPTGIAIAIAGAGAPGYSYAWSAPGGTGDSLTHLAAGTYQVTVSDMNNCTATASGTVALQAPAIIVDEVSQHDLKCFNDGTGDVYISTTDTAGGAASYTDSYVWSNGATTADLLSVQAGSYRVTVTDQYGCTGTATYTLTQPQPLGVSPSDTNPLCYGYADGKAAVSPTGGSGSYHYVWNTTPVQATPEATGLKAGTYTVTVSDDSMCTVTAVITLTDPLQILFAAPTLVDPSCYNDSNGTAMIVPLNGVGSYTYAWSYGSEATDPAVHLPAGTYTVTVTDNNGCPGTTTVTLAQPPLLTVTATETDDKCLGSSDGTVAATAAGGTPAYSYLWNNTNTNASLTALPAGTYTVTATDHNGCSASASATISQPTQVADTLTSVRTNCPNSTDGSITALASGGTGAFLYTLEMPDGTILQAGNTTGSFTGIGYGLYTVQATDQNGCQVTDTITVPRAPFDIYTDTAVSTTCYGAQYRDGRITVQGYTIANGPFQYSIDGGPLQTAPDFYSLSAGAHQVTAQDAYGCDTTFTVTVPEPLPAVLAILPADSTILAGTSLQLTNIFGPYSTDSIKGYAWSQGYGLNCIDCPSPIASPYDYQTVYSLSVTYNQGCVVVATATINVTGEPPVYIPNAFTPNGDGVNDVWYIYGTGIKDLKAMVFNRWGEKVFETDDQSIGWDGTYKGVLQPPGVYVYVAQMVYLTGAQREKQGSVTLIR